MSIQKYLNNISCRIDYETVIKKGDEQICIKNYDPNKISEIEREAYKISWKYFGVPKTFKINYEKELENLGLL